VDVDDVEDGGNAHARGGLVLLGEVVELVHLFGADEQLDVDPADDLGLGADLEEAAATIEDFEFFTVLDRGDDGGTEGYVLAEGEFVGSGEGFTDDTINRALFFLFAGNKTR
jgi:hypothetical protein